MNIEIYLPFPPTVNNYYVKTSRGMYISAKGNKYCDQVAESIVQQLGGPLRLDDRLLVEIILFPPDKRKRDVDNYNKSLLDALTKAGLWVDDEQIDQLHIYRGAVVKGGSVWMRIGEAGPVIPEGYTC